MNSFEPSRLAVESGRLRSEPLTERNRDFRQLTRFRVADDGSSICNTSASWLLVCRSSEQQQIPIRIFDDESFCTPRLFLQFLAKDNASGLKLKKQ
jgi:hypothetical protein